MKSPCVRRVLLGVSLAVLGLMTLRAADAPAKTSDKSAAGASKAGAATGAKKEEPMGKIDGVEVKRGSGYFGVALVGGNFKITFYDAKRHVVPVPFNRAVLHWPVNYRPTDDRTVLNLDGEGKSLTSAKIVKPPYTFKLFITFVAEGADEASGSETYTIDFRA